MTPPKLTPDELKAWDEHQRSRFPVFRDERHFSPSEAAEMAGKDADAMIEERRKREADRGRTCQKCGNQTVAIKYQDGNCRSYDGRIVLDGHEGEHIDVVCATYGVAWTEPVASKAP